jgi:hypothetical protein
MGKRRMGKWDRRIWGMGIFSNPSRGARGWRGAAMIAVNSNSTEMWRNYSPNKCSQKKFGPTLGANIMRTGWAQWSFVSPSIAVAAIAAMVFAAAGGKLEMP